jgi:hypothetical protein
MQQYTIFMWINKKKLTRGKIRSYFISKQSLLEIELVNEKYKKMFNIFLVHAKLYD